MIVVSKAFKIGKNRAMCIALPKKAPDLKPVPRWKRGLLFARDILNFGAALLWMLVVGALQKLANLRHQFAR